MPRPFTRNDSQKAARALRKGPGRPDTSPQTVGDRITRHRDPVFADRALRPSPALLTQPEPIETAPAPSIAPTFADNGSWHTLRLEIEPGTDVFGTGEVAGPFRRNGHAVSLRNTDAFGYDDTTEALYQSHPWVVGVRADGSAFGLLADSPRRGIVSGSISLHPQGIAHGPHPGTVEASLGKEKTDELAVMCDTFRPLFPTKFALDIDDPHYPESWRTDHHAPGEVKAAGNQDDTVNTWT